MNWTKRSAVIIVVAVLLNSISGVFSPVVFAEETPVTITADHYENGTLTFHWSQITGAKASVISFHRPNTDDTAAIETLSPVIDAYTSSISGLKADYIYDISVTVYGAVDGDNNPAGEPIGRGLLFYLPSITFRSTAPDQPYDTIPGGGQEIGGNPRLKLSWRIPKVFAGGAFIRANKDEARTHMQNSLNSVYMDNRELAFLNYKINISQDLNLLNSGPTHASLLIDQQSEDAYGVSVSGTDKTAEVTAPDPFGYMSFELWGRADESSSVPERTADYILPHDGILPGSVYYMNIKPIYQNPAKDNVAAVTVGNPADMNGSLLSGDRAYACTPIRFQLTKDSANNIYVKVYKINQGTLDLPRLFYEVQATDDHSIQGDWTVKKTMDDSYFSGSFAITVISGVNPGNKVYYKIVVKSESPNDRLESLAMPYTLIVDTSRPPLPAGIAVTDRTLHTGKAITPAGAEINVKSTDVTFSWNMPLDWTVIKNDVYFHFLLNTNQTDTDKNVPLYSDDTFLGSYPAKYRLVKYISGSSPKIREVGNRLEYTLDAFDLFTWEGDSEDDSGQITGQGDYPSFLLPNTVYYLQMYTSKAAGAGSTDPADMSDRSIVTSFTTLGGAELDVPLAMNFKLEANGKDTSGAAPVNSIDIRFDKMMNLDWRNYTSDYNETKYSYNMYYDVYMNCRTDTDFYRIGTTEDLHEDVVFTGADDPQSTSVRARISRFTVQSAVNLFGDSLLPNTTYYFKIVTRLVIRNKTDASDVTVKESIDTAILPVTTIRLDVTPPDDSLRRPLAPTDFKIAEDGSGDQLLSGNSVTFSWKRQERDVIYQLIRTSRKVGASDEYASYENDPEYLSFIQEYDTLSDGTANGMAYLDPAPPPGKPTHPGKFTYDSASGICTYTVDRRMFPNKLYYFSLKAVRVDAARVPLDAASNSVWVSIPVTTSLIDSPSALEVVLGAELGFSWNDATPGLTADDYKVYIKEPSRTAYILMNRSQSTIVKDKDGQTYYARIFGLKTNTYYDIRVTKGINTPVYEKTDVRTRDGNHELEIRWIGKPLDDYSRYDIAIMEEGASDYTILSAADLELYADKSGSVLPYYAEETARTVNTDESYYHARIKSADVRLAGGILTKQPLRSNVKYYIKIRTVKVDPVDNGFIAYSKYIGPVNTRTEFKQEDYDNIDREEQMKAVFLDRMGELEKGYFWRVAVGSNHTVSILLKGERVADAIKNLSGDTFTVDISALSVNIDADEIYVPIGVIKIMNTLNRSLLIKTSGAELLLRPMTLDVSSNEQVKEIMARQEVKDLYVKLIVSRSAASETALPSGLLRASDINGLNVQAMGLSRTDKDMAQSFHDRLYDKDGGLVSEKLNMLKNTYVGGGTGSADMIGQYARSLADMIEKELSIYIDNTLSSAKLSNTVRDITEFGGPVSASLSFIDGKGVKVPYVLYDNSTNWQKITVNTVLPGAGIRFNLIKTGRFVVMTAQSSIGDVPPGHWAEEYVAAIASKYDLGDVFAGVQNSFMPDNKATCQEVVLLYEKVTGKAAGNAGLDIRQKNVKLGLSGIIKPNSLVRNIKREETAAILLKLFSVKKGVSADSLKPAGRLVIADENSIGNDYFQPVLMIVDMKVMELDAAGKFYPGNQMTRAEVVAAFVKLLRLAGE